ncbi:MAG: thiamine diphosphokinase [Treponema sp.]|nr:thiamine diphosphokinase [Treponema sp.]
MLGVVFTGGEGPAAAVIQGALKDRDAFIVAADSGLQKAESAGISPDLIVGDMDSLDDTARLAVYPPQNVIRHKADKDATDTELAFSLVLEKGCDEVWIIGGGGGRIDHLFGIRSLFEMDIFPRRWITGFEDIHCIDAASGKKEISMNVDTGSIVSVFPLGIGPWKAKSGGLKWPLDDLRWSRGFFGLSNVAPNGQFSIRAEAGRFMVIVPLEGRSYGGGNN